MKRSFRNPFGEKGIDREIDDEIQDHITRRAESLMAKGIPESQAWAEARARFGDMGKVESECRSIQFRRRRKMRRSTGWDELRQDLRYGLRSLLRRPTFAAVALLTLAVGMGGTTAVFSIVNSVLLRPFPFDGADRVHFVSAWETTSQASLNAPTVDAWRRNATQWDRVAAFTPRRATIQTGDYPRLAEGWRITHEFFDLLAAPMTLGSGFAEQFERPGSEKVVVLTHGLWARELQSDPNVIGRLVSLDGESYRVTGVLGEAFDMSPELPSSSSPSSWTKRRGATRVVAT